MGSWERDSLLATKGNPVSLTTLSLEGACKQQDESNTSDNWIFKKSLTMLDIYVTETAKVAKGLLKEPTVD